MRRFEISSAVADVVLAYGADLIFDRLQRAADCEAKRNLHYAAKGLEVSAMATTCRR